LEARIDENRNKDAQQTVRALYRAASLASIGIEMGVAVALGWWFGTLLDDYFGTAPWLMIVFLLFGVAAAFAAVIRTAKQATRDQRSEASHTSSESNH
jgi:ATP synthase protein I